MNTPIVIVHCDANSFYCSCHRVFEPHLIGKPLGVLSNNDGCIIARTQELKALNVAMGTPLFQVRSLVKRGDIMIRSSNYPLYGDMSERFMAVLETFSPDVEVYSIDEAFLRFDGFSVPDWHIRGQQIQSKVGRWTGLPIGVGIATTKVLSKLANYAAKRYRATGGVVDLTSPERQKKLMAITPVEEVWGVGRQLAKKMKAQGIDTAFDLAQREPTSIQKQFSIVEARLVKELRGESCLPWEEQTDGNKHTIMCSRSFGRPVTAKHNIQEAVATYVARACEKLRAQGKASAKAQLFLRTSPFRDQDQQYSVNLNLALPWPTDSSQAWQHIARKGLDSIFREGYLYQKAGFLLLDIQDNQSLQNDLFQLSSTKAQSSNAFITTVDEINNRFGRNTLRSAASGFSTARWHMKQNYISPHFTTRWQDLPRVRTT
ncbi:Y-family DNA polymerase [Parendozoicomonas sp. Alg238-R29]|uniref:Y-family DNA polymerase n=1 Tax=Parendozoicomonas sp. Alg238-R29 TaxID=2993446 RepID=UPI00248E329A|nr:Y-family DNA polymerase [Parendozoicomonas sp. Alg238-R29]